MSGNDHSQDRIRNGWAILFGIAVIILLSGCAEMPKVYRVGIVCGVDSMIPIADDFKTQMTALGYVEGQNITYDMQKLNADPAGEERTAKKLVADKVDLIVALPNGPALAAKAASQGTNIPVVFINSVVETTDLVNSVREPGGNITGVRFPGLDISLKNLEVLLKLVPKAKRVWIAYDPNYSTIPAVLGALRPAALSSGITLVEAPVASVADLQAALQAQEKSGDIGMDAILMMPDLLTRSPEGFGAIIKFSKDHQVPVGGGSIVQVQDGSVFGMTTNYSEQGRLAATLVDKIFKGTPAGTLSVLTPESRLVLNYKRAQELGLTVPEGLLKQAAEIIR